MVSLKLNMQFWAASRDKQKILFYLLFYQYWHNFMMRIQALLDQQIVAGRK